MRRRVFLICVFSISYVCVAFGQIEKTARSNDTIILSQEQMQMVKIRNKKMPDFTKLGSISKPHVVRSKAELDSIFTDVAFTDPNIDFTLKTLLYIPFSPKADSFSCTHTIKIINKKLICYTNIIYPFTQKWYQSNPNVNLALHKDLSIIIPKINKDFDVKFIYNEIYKSQ